MRLQVGPAGSGWSVEAAALLVFLTRAARAWIVASKFLQQHRIIAKRQKFPFKLLQIAGRLRHGVPFPRQEFVEAIDRMVGDAGKNVRELLPELLWPGVLPEEVEVLWVGH